MRILFTAIVLVIASYATAQQVNPVPDYTFANRMSAGRNTVTDTAAYFSIGPRYGAVRGMMPPMVVDTASVSGNKRNGLLIFSIQKNKFLYWDSVGSKWAEMAGTGGSAITGAGMAGYMPEFTTATNLDSTTLYHSAGRFAIGSTTTSNGRFSVFGGQSYFDTSLKVGSQTLLADEGKNEVYVNTNIDSGAYALQIGGGIYSTTSSILAALSGNLGIGGQAITYSGYKTLGITGGATGSIIDMVTSSGVTAGGMQIIQEAGSTSFNIFGPSAGTAANIQFRNGTYGSLNTRLTVSADGNVGVGTTSPETKFTIADGSGYRIAMRQWSGTGVEINGWNSSFQTTIPLRLVANYLVFNTGNPNSERARITDAGEFIIGGGATDAGAFALQVTGAIYNTTTITTGAPTSGTAKPWRLGEVATVSPTSPNRTIRVEIDGIVYYIHAKTTND